MGTAALRGDGGKDKVSVREMAWRSWAYRWHIAECKICDKRVVIRYKDFFAARSIDSALNNLETANHYVVDAIRGELSIREHAK